MLSTRTDASVAACASALIEVLPPLARLLSETLQTSGPGARLTPPQYKVLLYLTERDHISSELARYLGVTPSSVTTLVDGLVQRGLAERVASPTDRRCVLVRISGAGSACFRQAQAQLLPRLESVVAGLPERDRQELASGLRALEALLEQAREPVPFKRAGVGG
jgi:DNA-binding MarR family transcriptional regulator